MANRISAASDGYRNMVAQNPTGWVVVGLMFIVAVFLIGYLIQRKNEEKKMAERKRKRERDGLL